MYGMPACCTRSLRLLLAWKYSGSRMSTPLPSASLYSDSALCSMMPPVVLCCAPSLRALAGTCSAAGNVCETPAQPQAAAAGAHLSRSPPLARIICAIVKSHKGCLREEASQLVDRLSDELVSRRH